MENRDIRQVILMRTDLDMGVGKMVTQGAHASEGAKALQYTQAKYNDYIDEWLITGHTKITLEVKSGEKLNNLVKKADEAGINVYVVTDEGRTVFNGVSTVTCACLGVAPKEDLDKITGRLRLLK
jgi:PTH2 family peptidyl-tRNA hydrolase